MEQAFIGADFTQVWNPFSESIEIKLIQTLTNSRLMYRALWESIKLAMS